MAVRFTAQYEASLKPSTILPAKKTGSDEATQYIRVEKKVAGQFTKRNMCDQPIWSATAANKRRATKNTIGKADKTKPISAKFTFRAASTNGIISVNEPETKSLRKDIA